MSLKSQLNQIIRERGSISIQEIEDFCHKAGYKLSNAERRLRKSESPDVEPLWNKKHTAIIGYQKREFDRTGVYNPELGNVCCYSFKAFKTHTRDCPVFNEMERVAKILEAETERQLKLI